MAPQSQSQSNDSKPLYHKDEKALCFHGEMLYDAKITDVERSDPDDDTSPFHYKVHYKGWKNTWDDWVPQDRLRKISEENRELQATLRHQAILKANPKMAGKVRRGQGSDIGSGRGSEERTSSVPAAGGRGSKRARDNDLEKVGDDAPSRKRTRVNDSDVTRDDDDDFDPRINMMPWIIGLPKNQDARKYVAEVKEIPIPNLDVRPPLDAESITSVACHFGEVDNNLDQPTTGEAEPGAKPEVLPEAQPEAEPGALSEALLEVLPEAQPGPQASPGVQQRRKDEVDLRQFLHVPRKAALKATTAIAQTNLRQPPAGAASAKKQTKKKNSPKSSNTAAKESDTVSSVHNVPTSVSKKSVSDPETVQPSTKDTKIVTDKGDAHPSKEPNATKEESKAQKASSSGRSHRTASADSANVRSDGLVFDTESEAAATDTKTENESEEIVIPSVKRSVRAAAAVSTAKSRSMLTSTSTTTPTSISKGNNGGSPSQRPDPSSSQSCKTSTAVRSTAALNTSRQLRSSKSAMASKARQPLRPWKVKDTTKYTSADVDHLLAQPPPKDDPELLSRRSFRISLIDKEFYNAPLISGTTYFEKSDIDDELRGARKNGKQYRLASRHGQKHELPAHFEELPSDIDSDDEDHGATSVAPFEVDPPGSNTPFDALKYPYRLIKKINSDGDKFPAGWTEENLKCIPNNDLVWVREELLVKLPYSVLENRPPWVLKAVPDNAPFWDQYERENEANIIKAFIAKAKRTPTDEHHALHILANVATDEAFEAAAQASRSIGMVTSDIVSFAACKRCIRFGVKCDGAKPICHCCQQAGRNCDFSNPFVEHSYMRRGSPYDIQQELANLTLDNLETPLEVRVPTTGTITGLDVLALAAEVVESGPANSAQDNLPGHSQDPGHGNGLPASRLAPMQSLARIAHILIRGFDIDRRMPAYVSAYLNVQEDAFYTRPSVRINVPDHLKNLLVDDWENVTKSLLLVPLPSQAPANYIIDEYFNSEKLHRRLCSPDADILEEFCAGLKMYFEKAVGKILLYRFERSQLAEVRKLWESGRHKEWEGKGPGDCYGAEHLTRMIVNLPEMIAQTNMDADAVLRLKTELSRFVVWLSRNSEKYFCAKYEKPSAEYIENAR